MFSFFSDEPKFDFIGKISSFWLGSGLLLVASVALLATRGLNMGIDFAGGYELQVEFPEVVSDADIVKALDAAGMPEVRVQSVASNPKQFIIVLRTTQAVTDKDAIEKAVKELAGSEENLLDFSLAESGQSFAVEFGTGVAEDTLRAALAGIEGLESPRISGGKRSDQPRYKVVFSSVGNKAEAALREAFSIAPEAAFVQGDGFVGDQVGKQFRTQGFLAVLWALGFIALYIGFRFDLSFAPGAIVALIHDVLITLGIFSALQLEFNLPIIAAILTIVGYSLNDTIVVYDRIRENATRLKGRELRALVNTSLNQTLSRTVLTSITTLLVIVALLAVGAGVIRDFSLALFIGVLVGTYSSLAIASPVYIMMREFFGERGEAKRPSSRTAAASA